MKKLIISISCLLSLTGCYEFAKSPFSESEMTLLEDSKITDDLLDRVSKGQWWQLALAEEADAQIVEALNEQYEAQKRTLDARFDDKVEKVRRGDDLPPGVMKMV